MEADGIIAKVTEPTPWVSSMVVVRKKDDKVRICIDPRDLNKAIKRCHYPMPTLEEVATRLPKAKVFSVLDAKSGFWQVKLSESSDIQYTVWAILLEKNAFWYKLCSRSVAEQSS